MSERKATVQVGLMAASVALSVVSTVALGAITGGDSRAIYSSDIFAITGGDARAITGGDGKAITGGDARAITGGDGRAITGGDARAITGGDGRAITGGDARAITGGDGRAITGGDTQLILVGHVSLIQSNFISVLGQSVFLSRLDGRFGVGTLVAVYGSIDFDTGSIADAWIVEAGRAGFAADSPSYLTGVVDSVDYAIGRAVVSGLMVDYNALLSTGHAPSIGDQVSITGRHYGGLGVLVADPQLGL